MFSCSFNGSGDECGSTGKGKTIVPLLSCESDLSSYLRDKKLAPDSVLEWELILNRARWLRQTRGVGPVFGSDPDLSSLTVCPKHRKALTTVFYVPRMCISPNHDVRTGKPKGKGVSKSWRHVGKTIAVDILRHCGEHVPIGAYICNPCRKNLYTLRNPTDEEEEEDIQPLHSDQPACSVLSSLPQEEQQQQEPRQAVHFFDDIPSEETSLPSTSQPFPRHLLPAADASSCSSNEGSVFRVPKVVSSTPWNMNPDVRAPPFLESGSDVPFASSESETLAADDNLPLAKRPRLELRSGSSSSSNGSDTALQQSTLWLNQTLMQKERRETVNALLSDDGFDPVHSTLNTDWCDIGPRQQNNYIKKVREGIHCVLSHIVPGQEKDLWNIVKEKPLLGEVVEANQKTKNIKDVDSLIQAYLQASTAAQLQILSLFANDYTKNELQQAIPGLSVYKIDRARHHAAETGMGELVPPKVIRRTRLDEHQVDHFIDFISDSKYLQDVAFGTRNLKMDSGEKLVIPNVVRTVIPARIIQQYKGYCLETGAIPLSDSTLFRIIEVCGASQQKSLQGLDYISAAGTEGFESLEKIVQESPCSPALDKTGLMSKLKSSKRYLKSEYASHVAVTSQCASHCITFGLCDPEKAQYSQSCDHQHNLMCTSCQDLDECLVAARTLPVTTHLHDVDQAIADIKNWRAHIMRAIQQDRAKFDSLQALDENSVLIVMDWAMKYLPAYFRECQTVFFGKRGISWHVTCVVSKQEELAVTCFVHIFEQVTQNWEAVSSILEHTLRTVKLKSPLVEKASVRSDNAGCYHNAMLLSEIPHISRRSGVAITAYNFSETQHGKDVCDRKIAPLKRQMKLFVAEKNNITNANEMKTAIESHGGVAGCTTFVCEVQSAQQKRADYTIPGISYLNNFEFETKGKVRAWKTYGMGTGEVIDLPDVCEPSATIKVVEEPCVEASVRPFRVEQSSRLFVCPEKGCRGTFLSNSELRAHLEAVQHLDVNEDNGTVYDGIRKTWAKKVTSISEKATSSLRGTTKTGTSTLDRGWALKATRKSPRMSQTVKAFLTGIFNDGAKSGMKANPMECAKILRTTFGEEDWRTAKQIASFFSRLAAEQKRCGRLHDEDEDEEALADDVQDSELKATVMEEVGIQHPVTVERQNLCVLFNNKKLDKCSVKLLKMFCKSLDLATDSSFKKADYLKVLKEILLQCSCR